MTIIGSGNQKPSTTTKTTTNAPVTTSKIPVTTTKTLLTTRKTPVTTTKPTTFIPVTTAQTAIPVTWVQTTSQLLIILNPSTTTIPANNAVACYKGDGYCKFTMIEFICFS